jgi:hypothetical protein
VLGLLPSCAVPRSGGAADCKIPCRPPPTHTWEIQVLIAKRAREQQTAPTAPSQKGPSDQKANEPAVVSTILFVVVPVFFSLAGPATKQVGEQQAAQTATPQHAAADQQARKPVLTTIFLFVVVLVFFSLVGSAA